MVRGSIYDNMKLSRRIFFSHEPLWKKAEAVESFMFLQKQRVDKRLLKVNIFVAFCSFFLGNLAMVQLGEQLKISGRQLKSSRVGQQHYILHISTSFWWNNHPKIQQNILLHSGMTTSNILIETQCFCCLKTQSVLNI